MHGSKNLPFVMSQEAADVGDHLFQNLWKPDSPFPLLKPFCPCFLSAEALQMIKGASHNAAAISPACYDHVIRSLLATESMEDAMAVKSM